MSELIVKVGAATDASFDQVFRKITSAARAANRLLLQEAKTRGAKELAETKGLLAQQAAAQKAAAAASLASHKAQLSALGAAQKASNAKLLAETKSRLAQEEAAKSAAYKLERQNIEANTRLAIEAERRKEREAVRAAKAIERAERGGGGRGHGRDMPYRMGYWASRNVSPVTPMLSVASRMGSDLARGAGIDLNVGSMVGNYVESRRIAGTIANSAYMPGDRQNGERTTVGSIMELTKEAADNAGLSRLGALEGIQKFVGKTGDLATGKTILKDLGVLSTATGTAFEDMVDAAGDVSNALGDIDNKGDHVTAVMRAIAGQGKIGAVEIKDLATQMAKLAAAAPQFEGTAEQNIGIMGALAQMTRAKGGAASATQAATSVMSFLNMFSKGARLDAFQNITGTSAIDAATKKIRSPEELILESLRATKGDTRQMGKIFADSGARRVVRGFETVYKEAGGGQAGLSAVHVEFQKLLGASMGKGEIAESFRRRMEDPDKKAQQFQNKLQDLTDEMSVRALPALEKLEPKILEFVSYLTKAVTWLAENPFAIVPAAIGAAIAKAGIEQTLRVGIENIFRNFLPSAGGPPGRTVAGSGGPVTMGGAGVMGNIAATLVIASLAITTATVGMMVIKDVLDKRAEQEKKTTENQLDRGNLLTDLDKAEKRGGMTPDQLKRAREALAQNKADLAKAQQHDWIESTARTLTMYAGRQGWADITAAKNKDAADARRIHDLQEEQIRILERIERATTEQTQKMINSALAPSPVVDPNGRTNWVEVEP